jgi:hypothetical protein
MRQLLFALPILLLAACGRPAGETSLFPLQAGLRWTYDVRTEYENNTVEHDTRVITSEGQDPINGQAAWRRRSHDGMDWWHRSDATGTYRVASKSDVEAEPQPDPQPRYVLKMPLAVGTSWPATTTPYLLRRRADFPPELRHTHPKVPMLFSIEAVGEAVQTRIGRFEGCVRVKGVSALRLFADPVSGWRDMPLINTEWYCPGPGLVRLVREEPARSAFLSGGTLTLELVAFE